MTAVWDIETDGLYYETKVLHCISIKVDDEPTKVYTSRAIQGSDGSLDKGLEILQQADVLVGHNIINFDIPTIEKLTGVNLYDNDPDIYDTMLMSKLTYPNLILIDSNRKTIPPKLKGSHSLKAWGYRLGNYKDAHEDWSKLSSEMVEYCRQDTEVTSSLYRRLLTKDIPEEAIWLENNFARIISRQEKYGVDFDVEKAQQLHIELMTEKDRMTDELQSVFKPLPQWIPMKEVKRYTKSGEESKVYTKQVEKGAHYNADGDWGRYEDLEFNPSSRQHIVKWMKHLYDWDSPKKTDKGNPVVDEAILKTLEYPEAQILAHYFNVNKLLGQLAEGDNAWLKLVKDDGRIHGSVDTIGAVTRRCTHSRPNMAQVPSVRAFKGSECRSLFRAGKGKKIVGCDASGLELRTLSHYLARYDRGKYGREVLEGDIHTANQKAAGLPTRDDAKTFIYAFLYGAGEAKLGTIVGGGFKEGKKLKTRFFKKIPAVKHLIDSVVTTVQKRGYLKALDGNMYYIRSEHSALNVLLQGAGALVMKYYLILLDDNIQKEYTPGVNYEFVLNVHDEVQIECDENIAEAIAKIAEDTFKDVTDRLDFRILLEGEAKIGENWKETH